MIIRDMDGSFKWTAEGKRVKHPKRGVFTETGAAVAWSRMGPRDVCGYVLALHGGGRRCRPSVRFAVSVGLLCGLVGMLLAGGGYLKRAAARAREESDALVEMLRKNVETQEAEHA